MFCEGSRMDARMRALVRKFHAAFLCAVTFATLALAALACTQESKTTAPKASETASAAQAGTQYSGMYSFLDEGEFVQITVEDEGKVTGYVSRYGEGGSDKGVFVEHFFRGGQ